MFWSYTHNPSKQIVEVVFSGDICADDLKDATSALISLEKDKALNRFLVDTREMKLSASLVDVYNLPVKQYVEEGADPNGRVALVLSRSSKEKEAGQFYETVCKNRGWDVQAFLELEDAVNWLTR